MACPCSFNGQFLIGPNNLYWSWRAKINIYVHDFRMAKQLLVRGENWSVYQYWQSFRRVWTKIHFSSPFNQNPSDELYHLQSLMIYLSGFATQDPIDNTQNVFSSQEEARILQQLLSGSVCQDEIYENDLHKILQLEARGLMPPCCGSEKIR